MGDPWCAVYGTFGHDTPFGNIVLCKKMTVDNAMPTNPTAHTILHEFMHVIDADLDPHSGEGCRVLKDCVNDFFFLQVDCK